MDNLLDLLSKDPGFRVFHLDGQSALIEDYLDLRPEKRNIITAFVAEGRLKIGPWYVQPDCFIVSGEAIMRNLLKGTSHAKEFGEFTKVGWLPDSFGHCAQMPQVLRNFEIDSFVFSRGLGDQLEGNPIEFFWESPHGDRVLAIHQRGGYYGNGNLAYPFFWGDISRVEPNYALAVEKLLSLAQSNSDKICSGVLAVWNGSDHTSPEHTLPETLRYAVEHLPKYRILHGSVEEYLELVRERMQDPKICRGELRDSRFEAILSSVLSSRVHIKQKNYVLERALERETEPLLVLAWLLSGDYPRYAVNDAWTSLLKNHFHDAICGCSIDQAHYEMDFEFAKTEQTIRQITHDALFLLADTLVKNSGFYKPFDHIPIMYVNGLVQRFSTVVPVTIDVPVPAKHYVLNTGDTTQVPVQITCIEEKQDNWIPYESACRHIKNEIHWWQEYLRFIENRVIVDFRIERKNEKPCLYLLCGDMVMEPPGILDNIISRLGLFDDSDIFSIEARFYEITLLAPVTLPAFGYTVTVLTASQSLISSPQPPESVRVKEWCMENRFLQVEIDSDGSVSMLHKESGIRYRNVHRFQDQADRGDTYDFCPISTENEIDTVLNPVDTAVEVLETGPVRGSVRIVQTFAVPSSLHGENRDIRSTEHTALVIRTVLRLGWELSYIECETEIDNRARDHRLRVYADAGIKTDELWSDGPFEVRKRPVKVPVKPDWKAPPPSVFPHDRWIALSDGNKGLALLSEGLREHAPVCGMGSTGIALTLIRSVGWLSRQDLFTRPGHGGPPIPTPDAQCQGLYRFRYGFYPFCGTVEDNRYAIVQTARQFDATVCTRQIAELPNIYPVQRSFLELAPSWLQMTALKQSENGKYICLRFFHPGSGTDLPADARLCGRLSIRSVWKARADETPVQKLCGDMEALDLSFSVEAAEIVTLLIEPG